MAIAEVIKFEGPQDALVWKFPIEDFNATSQLIVDETHEALLVVNGNAADLFTAGRRTLSVSNIPIARNLIEIPSGGNSPFPCKVFLSTKFTQWIYYGGLRVLLLWKIPCMTFSCMLWRMAVCPFPWRTPANLC